MSNKEVLVRDIGRQDNKRKDQGDAETGKKTKNPNITSVSREAPEKNQNPQKTREKQQQHEYPRLLSDGAVLAWLEYISRFIYLGERYVCTTIGRYYM